MCLLEHQNTICLTTAGATTNNGREVDIQRQTREISTHPNFINDDVYHRAECRRYDIHLAYEMFSTPESNSCELLSVLPKNDERAYGRRRSRGCSPVLLLPTPVLMVYTDFGVTTRLRTRQALKVLLPLVLLIIDQYILCCL
jgi:hypothetical protein